MAADLIEQARLHAIASQLTIDYQVSTAELWAQKFPEVYDVITCLECLEHVPDPLSIIKACYTLLKPGGVVFFSTLNRNFKAYALAIILSERILKIVPPDTHQYEKLIRPSELNHWLQLSNLSLKALAGLKYNPISKRAHLSTDLSINYLAYARKEY